MIEFCRELNCTGGMLASQLHWSRVCTVYKPPTHPTLNVTFVHSGLGGMILARAALSLCMGYMSADHDMRYLNAEGCSLVLCVPLTSARPTCQHTSCAIQLSAELMHRHSLTDEKLQQQMNYHATGMKP